MTEHNVEERLREANKNPLYICPEQHRWVNEAPQDAPLVNIKCPSCGKTAVRHSRAVSASRHKNFALYGDFRYPL